MIGAMISRACIAVPILASLGAADSLAKDVTPAKIAIANLDFVDTSGEVKDEAVRHEMQLREFEAVLQETISRSQKLDPVAMSCGEERCSLAAPGVDQLLRQALAANARYLLAGGRHKMSTLIGWAKFIVFDLEKSDQVCDRLLTYRGDTAEAWQRAAKFSAGDIIKYCFADDRQPG